MIGADLEEEIIAEGITGIQELNAKFVGSLGMRLGNATTDTTRAMEVQHHIRIITHKVSQEHQHLHRLC